MGKRSGTRIRRWYRWDRLKRARVPTVSMIWQGMPGNGSATGITRSITRTVRRRTRRGRNKVTSKYCGAARGTAGRSPSILRIETMVHRRTTRTTTTGFAVRKLRSLWSFYPRDFALCPKEFEIARSHVGAGDPSWLRDLLHKLDWPGLLGPPGDALIRLYSGTYHRQLRGVKRGGLLEGETGLPGYAARNPSPNRFQLLWTKEAAVHHHMNSNTCGIAQRNSP